MEKLKEYAGVIVALMTVMTALASLSLWAIHVQINPEIRRLDGRIESFTDRVDRTDARWEARVDRMDAGWEARFNRIEARSSRIESDIKTILLRLPKRPESG
jgi:hypothetical protein